MVRGRACYLSGTEDPHNNKSLRVSGEETFGLFETLVPELGTNSQSPTFQVDSFKGLSHPVHQPFPPPPRTNFMLVLYLARLFRFVARLFVCLRIH